MSNSRPSNNDIIPKADMPAVNPYQAFVAAHDPDGTIPDGRVYVGTKSHYLDKPASVRPSMQAPKHNYSFNQTQTRPSPGPQSMNQNRPQVQTRSEPAQPQSISRAAPPAMHPTRNKSTSSQNSYRGTQQSQSHAPQPSRNLADSRWAGRSLATAAALPEGFFSTAKAGVPSPTITTQTRSQFNNSSGSLQQRRSQSSSADQGFNIASTQKAFSTLNMQDMTMSASSPRSLNQQQNVYQQQQQQQRSYGVSSRDNGQFENGRSGSQVSSYYQGSGPRSIRDDDYSDDDRTLVAPNRTNRPRMSMQEDPGNPRFFQYNIGDGCHMVVAMYMEKDASTALARFPQLTRVRNDSSSSVKSIDEVTNIFKSALIEEKNNLTG
ncbi:hypothetical protein FBU30_008854 [Linnemannia zychae]|nr:hypothetical protein FBU30_008854 [Linnemannia zychae]